jgi:hypothetical protein
MAAISTSIDPSSFGPLCSATGLCGNSPATGILSLVDFLIGIAIPAAQNILIGLSTLYFGWYALTMILGGYDESTLTEQRKAFGYAAIGMGIVGTATLIVNTVSPSAAGSALLSPGPFSTAVGNITTFIIVAAGAFLVFHISLAGFRIIVLQGNESEIDKQKKNFFNGLLGVMVLLLAGVTVNAILPPTVPLVAAIGLGGPLSLVGQIGGVARFLLQIIAALGVVSLIGSGLLFIIALHNDTLKQRARRILLSTIIILIVVLFSYTIVASFLPATAPLTTF